MKGGDIVFGSMTYVPATDSYDVYHKSETDGWEVTMNIPVQKVGGVAKKYTILYAVYEKVAPCGDYPPDGAVSFYNISVAYDGKAVPNKDIVWKTGYVEDVCNNRAVVAPGGDSITISWDTKYPDPPADLIAKSQAQSFRGKVKTLHSE